jgi:hypothetical protein
MTAQLRSLPASSFTILAKLLQSEAFAAALDERGLLVARSFFLEPPAGPAQFGILLDPEVYCPAMVQAPGQWVYGICL